MYIIHRCALSESCGFIAAMIRRYMIMKMYVQRSRRIFVSDAIRKVSLEA